MKKLLCLCLILLLLPASVLAEAGPLYTATAKITGPIYAEMDRDSERLGRVGSDSSVSVYAIYPEWLLVGSGGVKGYVPRTYLNAGKAINRENTPPWGVVFYQYVATVGDEDTPIYDTAGTNGEVLFTLPAGAKVSVMDLVDGWARVAYYRKYGYVDTNRLAELLPVCTDAASGTDYAPIATFTSYYVVGSEDEGVHGKEINIGVNCEDMNGRILQSGETLNYDDYFGPYLASKKYVKGPVLIETGWGLGQGGGVCQVSSTLYNVLAQLPGVNVVYHTSHGPNGIAYLPLDMDAAVGNPTRGINLIFRNEYPFPLRFEALAQKGVLYIAMYRVTE